MDSKNDKASKRGNQNALKHGAFSRAFLLPEEDRDELRTLRQKLKRDLRPQGETEQVYFDIVVTWAWRLLRCARWINENKKGDDFELATEIDIPARLTGEFDKAVRRFFQFRATRNMFKSFDEQSNGELQRDRGSKSLKALPAPNRHGGS
jgi:hypothetical protein